MFETGHRMTGAQEQKDERSLPSKERCEQVLEEPNHDTEPWVCPLCGAGASRAHWIADHILNHLKFPQRRY